METPTAAVRPPLPDGTRVAHYEIRGVLGSGGMGIVYRAADLNLERDVALKCVRPDRVSDPEYRRRLLNEARAASRLSHPNIVGVLWYPNIVPKAQSSNAWWKSLLLPGEATAAGGFLAIHDPGDPELHGQPGCQSCLPGMTGSATNSMLGLYWGAPYGTVNPPAAPNACKVSCGTDQNGNTIGTASPDYLRPMAACKMRTLKCPYCRACEEKIREAIVLAAP
jgi:protein kinase-like protein